MYVRNCADLQLRNSVNNIYLHLLMIHTIAYQSPIQHCPVRHMNIQSTSAQSSRETYPTVQQPYSDVSG